MSERNLKIDGLRGAMVLYVCFLHVGLLGFTGPSDNLMVFIFFALSGFLVYGSMIQRREKEESPFRNFYIRRAFRILPVWWLVLLVEYFRGAIGAKIFWANATFLFGFLIHRPEYTPVPPSWSLFVEEFFYVLFPLIFVAVRSGGLTVLLAATMAIAPLFTRFAPSVFHLPVESSASVLFKFPLANMQYFLIGILFWQALNQGHLQSIESFVKRHKIPWLDLTTALVFTLVFSGTNLHYSFVVATALVCALTEGTWFSKVLKNPVLVWCGVRCYGLYIMHFTVFEIFHQFHPAIKLAAVIATGALVFALVERPALRLAKRWIQRLESKPESSSILVAS